MKDVKSPNILQKKTEFIKARRLKAIVDGIKFEDIALSEGCSKNAIYRHFYRMLNEGLITENKELGESGYVLIKWLEECKNVKEILPDMIRLHNLQFKVKILSKLSNWNKKKLITKLRIDYEFETKNWEINNNWFANYYTHNVEVRIMEEFILIRFLNDVFGADTTETKNKALDLLYKEVLPRVEKQLKIKLGSLLSCQIYISKQHFALINNEFAKLFIENKIELKIYDEEGNLRLIADNSHGIAELEPTNLAYAESDCQKIKQVLTDYTVFDAPTPSDVKQAIDTLNVKMNLIGSIIANICPQYSGSSPFSNQNNPCSGCCIGSIV